MKTNKKNEAKRCQILDRIQTSIRSTKDDLQQRYTLDDPVIERVVDAVYETLSE